MTLRKAVGALVEEGLLERVKGSGTFVRSEIPEQKVQKILGLVLPAWGAPENLDTVMHYSQACEENNWLLKVIYVRSWEDRSIHDLLGNCDALVLTVIQEMASMPSFLCEKLFTSPKPVVVNKGSAEVIGRDSVYYVRDGQMEIPCDRLYELGHRRILLVDQVTRRDGKPVTIHPNMKGFEEIFRRKYPDVEYNTELMAFEIPLYGQPHPAICRAFEERRGGAGRLHRRRLPDELLSGGRGRNPPDRAPGPRGYLGAGLRGPSGVGVLLSAADRVFGSAAGPGAADAQADRLAAARIRMRRRSMSRLPVPVF